MAKPGPIPAAAAAAAALCALLATALAATPGISVPVTPPPPTPPARRGPAISPAPVTPSGARPFQDTSLSFEQRAADIVSHMSLQEKAEQMQTAIGSNGGYNIQSFRWGAEGLHGVSGGNVYPDAMAMGATFDPALVKRVGAAIGDDARARANPNSVNGMILWCPTVNMVRDPRWGRNFETFGEDPYLSSRLGAAYCLGMQGEDPTYIKIVATPKHYVVYSQEQTRVSANAYVSQRALREYYLPVFEACFTEGHAASVMSAFNAVNGIPCSANQFLLTNILRDEWHFQGAVCTDARAVTNIYSAHHYTDSPEAAVAAAINAGVDVITDQQNTASLIVQAVNGGLIKPEVIDRAVTNSLLVRFRLGLFDPPDRNPFAQLRSTAEMTQNHVNLALEAARESITLLQNEPAPRGYGSGPLLPLDLKRINSLAIVGPNAAFNLYGSYPQNAAGGIAGAPVIAGRGPAPMDAIRALVGDRVTIHTAFGTDWQEMANVAQRSDVVLFLGGNDTRVDRAGTDRQTLDLPSDQINMIDKVTRANPLTVLLLTGGSSINLDAFKNKCPAIVMHWYNGEQAGTALAEVLVGAYNPAGRLPITFYRSLSEAKLPPMDDYEVTPGRTYLYYKTPVSFPFGHGLSYTQFTYDNLKINPPAPSAQPGPAPDLARRFTVSFDLANSGARDGDEVAQVYVRQVDPKIVRPIKQLVAMSRLAVGVGQNKRVTLTVPLKSLAYWDEPSHQWAVDPGEYEFMVGASSQDIRQRATIQVP